jgi:uncharacterized protein YhaN
MRIDRLNLTAYGCFTNVPLDLAVTGRNMVVIYGENEAGKSTALRALRHWLFGFDKAIESVGFIHKSASLRIGGVVSADPGHTLTAVRRKGIKDTLLDSDGRTPLKDGAFDPFLGSVTAKQFDESFGLDLERLQSGGRDLAEGKGSLGAALFATASGIASLQKLRSEIARRKEELFAVRRPNATINADLKEFAEAKKAWEASLVPHAEAARLDEQVTECRQALDEVKARVAEVTSARETLMRLLRGRSRVLKSADLQRQRMPLQDVTLLDPGFPTSHTTAVSNYRQAASRLDNLDDQVRRLDGEIASITVDDTILVFAETVTSLASARQSVKQLAIELKTDEQLVNSKLGEAKQALRRLGLPLENVEGYVDTLRLNDRERKRLKRLANDFTKLSESLAAAERARTERDRDWKAAVTLLQAHSEPVDTTVLAAVVDEVTGAGDLGAPLAALLRETKELESEIASAQLRLGCPCPIDDPSATPLPALESIGYYRERLDAFDLEESAVRKRQRELEAERSRVELDLARIEVASPVPRPEELHAARAKRDDGWELIRRAWLEADWNAAAAALYAGEVVAADGLARSYAAAVAESDAMADRLTAEADRVRQRL